MRRVKNKKRQAVAKVHKRMLWLIIGAFLLLILLFVLLVFLMLRYQIFSPRYVSEQSSLVLISIIVSVAVLSQGATVVWMNRIRRPVDEIIEVIELVSQGDFGVSIDTSRFRDEMLELGEQLNSMIAQLNSIEVMRSDFVSNVSHEFKAPLSSIQGSVTLLSNPSNTEEQRAEYFELLQNATSQFSSLVENVLKLSKLESGNEELRVKRFRLDEQLRRAVLMYEHVWIEKDIELDLSLPECGYLGSEELLQHVWMNLIGNAVKYTQSGGRIAIELDDSDEKHVRVSVEDNGAGMTKQVKEHAFEKFYQGDSSRKSAGNGLGLALVSSICQLTGSKISLESELGRGSKFTVFLPK